MGRLISASTITNGAARLPVRRKNCSSLAPEEAIARLAELPTVKQLSVRYFDQPIAVPWNQVNRIRQLDWVQLEYASTKSRRP